MAPSDNLLLNHGIILQGQGLPQDGLLSMLGFSCKACGCLIMHSSSPVMFSCKIDCFFQEEHLPPEAVGCFLKWLSLYAGCCLGRSFSFRTNGFLEKAFLFSGAFLLQSQQRLPKSTLVSVFCKTQDFSMVNSSLTLDSSLVADLLL